MQNGFLFGTYNVIFTLVGLLAVRVALKSYLNQLIDLAQLSRMFFLLAFAMSMSW
ncbi:TPA: DUF1453 family protein [Bacillus cereus]|nr:DUF1453 domain-containing protein [Bacillus cereus]HDR4604900.1 DUF1453 family protein [Bacillus cereus]HDR4633371.1 DUF1453 family protein [Bacillus cereus]